MIKVKIMNLMGSDALGRWCDRNRDNFYKMLKYLKPAFLFFPDFFSEKDVKSKNSCKSLITSKLRLSCCRRRATY